MIPTKERLARVLAHDGCPAEMVARARAGWYDDFDAPDDAPDLPQIALIRDLTALGRRRLAARAAAGEFESTKAESDAWWEREGRAEMGLEAEAYMRTHPFPFPGASNRDIERIVRGLVQDG